MHNDPRIVNLGRRLGHDGSAAASSAESAEHQLSLFFVMLVLFSVGFVQLSVRFFFEFGR